MSAVPGGPVQDGVGGAAACGAAADGVDWEGALRLARLATPAGPRVPGADRRGIVVLLRRSAEDALPWAAQITGMSRAGRLAAQTMRVLVVDRAGLQRANAAFLRTLMERVPEPAGSRAGVPDGVGRAAVTGAVAGLLGLVSTRVLGQVLPAGAEPGEGGGVDAGAGAGAAHQAAPDPAQGAAAGPGAGAVAGTVRMLLVAPNVLGVQREWDLDRLDLPAWVALHEAAHVLQLTAAPWLADYLAAQVVEVADALVRLPEPGEPRGVSRLVRALRSGTAAGPEALSPLLADRLGAAERERLAAVAATMALLEGHAEAVLDAVEPSRMPSVHRLRAVLRHSRDGAAATVLERLLGAEAKRAQYVDGAEFVRAVVDRVGHAGLNVVWRAPENLPRPEEIARPEAWIERLGL
ncbi:zinc-dependent metalloprotease [Actinomyces procaprae]|uniref:zinc-dependent metalloprotease n=1 Tax=Actinomyces procaprae TaxID=2560010 RepID=UPI001F02C222|nr:zinc-dependent metalloprotease [Actinomyces procaprae]